MRQGTLSSLGGTLLVDQLTDNFALDYPDSSAQVSRRERAVGNSRGNSALGYRHAGTDQDAAGQFGGERGGLAQADTTAEGDYRQGTATDYVEGDYELESRGRHQRRTDSEGTLTSEDGATHSESSADSNQERNSGGRLTDSGSFVRPTSHGTFVHKLSSSDHGQGSGGASSDGSRDASDSSGDGRRDRDSDVTEHYDDGVRQGTRKRHTITGRNTEGTSHRPAWSPGGPNTTNDLFACAPPRTAFT